MKRFLAALALMAVPKIATASCPVSGTLQSNISGASAGDVIVLDGIASVPGCPEVTMSQSWTGGALVFSDSPESPASTGKLYEDATLGGTSGGTYNRIFSYHVNNSGSTKRFAVILKNRSAASCTLTVQKAGRAGPTTSFIYAGKLAYNRWDTSSAGSGVAVAAGAWAEIDATFDSTNVGNGQLLHGIWDYSFPCAHTIDVCMLSTTDSPTGVCPGKALLSRDGHVRGTFPNADKTYDTAVGVTILTSTGALQFPIAGGTTNDDFATGFDNAVNPPTAETNSGNYGVLYKMHLTTSSDDGRAIGLCYNPRAGQWGGAEFVMVGNTPLSGANHVLVPPTTGTTGDSTKCGTWGRYGIAASPSTTIVWGQFMPTGGSAFPVRVVTIPH